MDIEQGPKLLLGDVIKNHPPLDRASHDVVAMAGTGFGAKDAGDSHD